MIDITTLPDNLSLLPYDKLLELWKNHSRTVQKLGAKGIEFPDDPIPRCGYFIFSTTWIYRHLLKCEDPFLMCCMAHDIEYGLKRKPKSQVDKELLTCCLNRADTAILKVQAFSYYGLVRTVGYFAW